MNDPDPCATLRCDSKSSPVELCQRAKCCHFWQREAREDRAKREAADSARDRASETPRKMQAEGAE